MKTIFSAEKPCQVVVSPASMRLYIYDKTGKIMREIDCACNRVMIEDEGRRIAHFSGSDEFSGTVYDVMQIRLLDDEKGVLLMLKGARSV